MDERKERERRLQNERFSRNHGSRGSVDGFYAITNRSHEYFAKRLAADCHGKRVLEIGCGQGDSVLRLARQGAIVTGIDLSEVAIENARQNAARMGITDATFKEMDAEQLDFEAGSFDIVCGGAILHHLNVDKAFAQIARLLAPGGYALFIEPLGYNPFINLYRRLTPSQRTPDEHPLVQADLLLSRRYFAESKILYYYLAALLALPLLRTPLAKPMVSFFNAVDTFLFARVPSLRRYAWIMVLEFAQPQSVTNQTEVLRAS